MAYTWEHDGKWLAEHMDESVVLVGYSEKIFACNTSAKEFYRRLGSIRQSNRYVGK